MVPVQYLRYALSLILGGGVVFAWSTLIGQFERFFDLYGTLFKVSNCIVPNPLVTPCLYGATALIGALVWSLWLLYRPTPVGSRWLRNFLVFGVVFAVSVVTVEALQFYQVIGGPSVSCSPGASPTQTPCFTGMLFFAAACLVSWAIAQIEKFPRTVK